MAGENDQTRWIGIRPTNPAENIPVTESAPLTDILVAPSAGSPEFLTLTKKRSPAIADLQAIKDQWIVQESWSQVGLLSVTKTLPAVPAGEMWVVKLIACSQLSGTVSHLYHILLKGGTDYYLNGVLAPTARNFLFTKAEIVLVEGDQIRIIFGSLSNGAYTTYTVAGIKLGLY